MMTVLLMPGGANVWKETKTKQPCADCQKRDLDMERWLEQNYVCLKCMTWTWDILLEE
jgi:hypothetical protein